MRALTAACLHPVRCAHLSVLGGGQGLLLLSRVNNLQLPASKLGMVLMGPEDTEQCHGEPASASTAGVGPVARGHACGAAAAGWQRDGIGGHHVEDATIFSTGTSQKAWQELSPERQIQDRHKSRLKAGMLSKGSFLPEERFPGSASRGRVTLLLVLSLLDRYMWIGSYTTGRCPAWWR